MFLLLWSLWFIPQSPAKPDVAQFPLFRPHYDFKNEVFSAGTSFLAKLPGHREVFLLSVHHAFGPAGGLDRDYLGWELKALLRDVEARPIQAGFSKFTSKKMVVFEDAESNEDPTLDLSAFRVVGAEETWVMKLRPNPPKPGEKVWLFAQVQGSQELLHQATVVRGDKTSLVFKYTNPSLKLWATSGAPIIDANGHVLGLNVSMSNQNGELLGFANPSLAVIPRLTATLKQ